jgi:3'-5' exoribonuclease
MNPGADLTYPVSMLPPIRQLTAGASGIGFFICTQKEVRPGRNGDFLSLTLQDATGRVVARAFDDVARLEAEFEAGEFVKVKARASLYKDQLQLIVENIRRVHPEQDRKEGFSEEKLVLASARPIDEMWAELQGRLAGVADPFVKALLERIVSAHEARLRVWPAAQTLHHAYRGGFLEHVLQMAAVGGMLAKAYGADADLVFAGVVLHDIGKLQELDYDLSTRYSRDGRLIGHIVLGAAIVREAAQAIEGFPPGLLTQIEHLVLSHHGHLEYGSPVVPMTVEAFILSFADDLDARINMVRQAIRDDAGDGEFTGYHKRLDRVLWKGRAEE